jgi:hypothetical protein
MLNRDPKAIALTYLARSTWILGYPEKALRIGDASYVHARLRGHPLDQASVLIFGNEMFDHLGEPDEMQ